jgi:hypothetical protein
MAKAASRRTQYTASRPLRSTSSVNAALVSSRSGAPAATAAMRLMLHRRPTAACCSSAARSSSVSSASAPSSPPPTSCASASMSNTSASGSSLPTTCTALWIESGGVIGLENAVLMLPSDGGLSTGTGATNGGGRAKPTGVGEPDDGSATTDIGLPGASSTGIIGKYGFTSSTAGAARGGGARSRPGVGGSAVFHGGASCAGVSWWCAGTPGAHGCSPAGVGGSAIVHGSRPACAQGRSLAGVGGSAMCHGCASSGGDAISPFGELRSGRSRDGVGAADEDRDRWSGPGCGSAAGSAGAGSGSSSSSPSAGTWSSRPMPMTTWLSSSSSRSRRSCSPKSGSARPCRCAASCASEDVASTSPRTRARRSTTVCRAGPDTHPFGERRRVPRMGVKDCTNRSAGGTAVDVEGVGSASSSSAMAISSTSWQ